MSGGGYNVSVERTSGPHPASGTIVFVNSLATTSSMWDGVVTRLPKDFDVVRFDQRDRGGPLGHSPFSLDDLVSDLFAVLDDENIEEAHIAGVSLGGLVALRSAAVIPHRTKSAVAMCCAARFSKDVWLQRAQQVRAHGVTPLVPQVIDRWFTPDFQQRQPIIVDQHRQMLASTDPTGYAFACDLLAESDVTEDLPAIEVPLLVVSGGADSANPVTDQQLIARNVPSARHEVLNNTAHLAPVAEPELIANLVSEHARLHN
ncbi:alpha/beta fold hydrolase [Arthrobacter sp. B1I2]|uniref:alpha/beta fold hydrolase n=1 Tax=Arthrobacter sp. B1I2 TaxID=3042263 RepID=UPI002789BB70|nr:alpha/beta fold hydrolase [Arthrobacter sp. B1I2]MDQ0733362.1 3-oxoadipate enol-lactonase [Arthrobacter sp. B1I2]